MWNPVYSIFYIYILFIFMSALRFSHGHILIFECTHRMDLGSGSWFQMLCCFLKIIYNEIKMGSFFFLIINKLQIVTVHREINGGYLHWGAEMIHFVSVWNDVKNFQLWFKNKHHHYQQNWVLKWLAVPSSKTQMHSSLNSIKNEKSACGMMLSLFIYKSLKDG